MIRDGAEATSPELVETYQSMLAAYDEDPANLEKYADVYKSTYLRLGAFFMNNDDKEQARSYFNKALALDPENDAIKDLIKKLDK